MNIRSMLADFSSYSKRKAISPVQVLFKDILKFSL